MAQVRYTRNLFLRGISIIYLFAFLGFYIQIPGLYGDNGIAPARAVLDLTNNKALSQKLAQKPTLLWFAPYLGLNVEYMLDLISLCGILISFCGFISQKFCNSFFFATLWVFYYSLYQIGQVFMSSQWDELLLETGILCIFVAPLWHSKQEKHSSPRDSVTLWSIRWLLFRLQFSTGIVKFASGCPLWWSLKALTVHFESMVLPSYFAWYAHLLPVWFLKVVQIFTMYTEIIVPFLFFFPNAFVRIIAFCFQLFLQLSIIATGHFGYLNFLIICLTIPLLDDDFFYRRKKNQSSFIRYIFVASIVYTALFVCGVQVFKMRVTDNWTVESEIGITKRQFDLLLSRVLPIAVYIAMTSLGFTVARAVTDSIFSNKNAIKSVPATVATLLCSTIISALFALSVIPFSQLHPAHNITVPTELKNVYNKVSHLHLVNKYGLFRKMPGADGRSEIIITGSDSINGPWKEYEFMYKPGNVNNSLWMVVAPYQPRLDWQMWFAAQGDAKEHSWTAALSYRLLTGQPEVLALLNQAKNPFKNAPPKFIRAHTYKYHYAKRSGPTWWTRQIYSRYFLEPNEGTYSLDDERFMSMINSKKLINSSNTPKVTNAYLKNVFDYLRSVFSKIEGSMILWSIFAAGCAINLTG